jgi:hypothetical protein
MKTPFVFTLLCLSTLPLHSVHADEADPKNQKHFQAEEGVFLTSASKGETTGGVKGTLTYGGNQDLPVGGDHTGFKLSLGVAGDRMLGGFFLGGTDATRTGPFGGHAAIDAHFEASPHILNYGLNVGSDYKNTSGHTTAQIILPLFGGAYIDRDTGYTAYKTGARVVTEQELTQAVLLTASLEGGALFGTHGGGNTPYLLGQASLAKKLGKVGYVKLEGIYEGQNSKTLVQNADHTQSVKDTSSQSLTGMAAIGAMF